MINTYSFDSSLCKEKTITVPTTFSMAACSVDETKLTNMGGFSFIVDRDGDGTFTKCNEIKAPNNGEAPQMICVPGSWKWPTERTNISDAYSDFGSWGKNYAYTDWLDTAVDDKVIAWQ